LIATWRRARADDAPLAWLWTFGVASAVALVPAAPWLGRLSPACPFHVLTGVPCPTCGATRAALALAAFDLRAAFASNPLVACGLVALALGGLVAPVWVAARAPLPRADERVRRALRVAVPAALAANWAYLIAARI
jgi:hypothetical protein